MDRKKKPKVGILFLSAQWLKEIGADKGFYSKLPELIEQDAQKIREKLEENLEILDGGVIATREKVQESVRIFKDSSVVLVIVCYLTWGEDWLLLEAVKKLSNIPFLLWCYIPFHTLKVPFDMNDLFRASGPVGTLQGSGPLKRMGKSWTFVFGSSENKKTIKEIVDYATAAKLVAELKKITIGLLPCPCDQMSGTYVDHSLLKTQLGPEVKIITVKEYYDISQKITEKEIENYAKELKRIYKTEVSEKALKKAVRASLGLAKIVDKHQLKTLALQDLDEELHRTIGLRPCLYVPSLFEKAVVSMEGDVGAAVALFILKELAGKPPMYTEIFTYDEKENIIIAGHAGIHDINLADNKKNIRITPDYEYMEVEPDTAWMQFKAKEGKVTLLSLFCESDRFKMIISSGIALTYKRKLDISPYICIRLDIPLREFFSQAVKTGMTQHWAVVHKDVVNDLLNLTEILNLDRVLLK